MYDFMVPSNYSKNLTSILEMLWNIEKDLNLVSYNETEKKIYYIIAWKLSNCGTCNISDVIDSSGFSRSTVYKTIKKVSSDPIVENKNTIGFVGAPWTLLVYMINLKSPKKDLNENFFKDDFLINRILLIIEKFLKVHIKNQIDSGANVIQIFDSWAGLLEEKDLPNYIYTPTLNLVEYVKSLNIPVICFPREIKNYKEFCDIVNPDAISIDYNVNPKKILQDIKIPIQGGLDPKILLTDYENLKKEACKYLEIFKDHPYIFNLGHGILPETNPEMVKNLIKIVKNYK